MNLTAWLRPYVDRLNEPHAMSAEDAAHDLLDLALSGDDDAAEACRSRLRESLTREIKSQRQAGHTTTLVAGKRRAKVKTMPSRPLVSVDTGEQMGWNLSDLWDLNLTDLGALLQRQLRERLSVSDRIIVTRRLLACLERHPECATAREAWLADGQSLTEIDASAA